MAEVLPFEFVATTGGGVPEPASLALVAMGCMAVLRRKRN